MTEQAKSIVRSTSAGVVGWNAPEWNDERRALARKAVTPPTATEAEFDFFIAWCQRTGLDPFIKQAYLVERSAKNPATGNYEKKHEPLASEAGMAARADALPDFRGMKCAAVYAGDVFEIDEQTQTIVHRWNLADRKKANDQVIGAWAHGSREGRTVPITWLPLASRIQLKNDGKATQFWAKDPAGQIAKCARAEQYRRLYPNVFGGAFIREEWREEEIEIVPSEEPRKLVDGGVASLRDRIVKPPAKVPAPDANPGHVGYTPAESEGAKAGRAAIDMRAEAARAEAEAAAAGARAEADRLAKAKAPGVAAPAADGPARDHQQTAREPVLPLPLGQAVMRFGPGKGVQLIGTLTGVELDAAKKSLSDELKKNPSAPWRDQAVAALAEFDQEQEQRAAALARDSAPEPGSEG